MSEEVSFWEGEWGNGMGRWGMHVQWEWNGINKIMVVGKCMGTNGVTGKYKAWWQVCRSMHKKFGKCVFLLPNRGYKVITNKGVAN